MGISKNYFDNIAGEWDNMQQSFFSDDVREKAYTLASIEPHKKAADIGAGTGFISEGLLKEGVEVVAVDQSKEMLELMEEKFSKYSYFTSKQGESDKLPLANNEVDYVFANMYLHHVENPLVAIKEMYRILKTGGKMVITDLDTHEFAFLKTEQYDVWMGFERNQLIKWLEEAGFEHVNVTPVGCKCCAHSEVADKKASISIFAAYGEKR